MQINTMEHIYGKDHITELFQVLPGLEVLSSEEVYDDPFGSPHPLALMAVPRKVLGQILPVLPLPLHELPNIMGYLRKLL